MEKLTILGGGRYLPFARRMVQQLKRLNLPRASKVLVVDGVTIAVRIEPNVEHIRIQEEEPALYDFFTTGNTTEAREFGESVTGYFVSIQQDKKTNELKAIAVGSSKEEPPEKEWAFNKVTAELARYKAFQAGAIPLPQYWPSVSTSKFAVQTWTSGSQADDLAGGRDQKIQPTPQQAYDLAYDAPVTIFSKTGYPKGTNGVAPDADWYRKSASARVNSGFGSRVFGFLTDVSGVLHVFPIGETEENLAEFKYRWQQIKTNIPEANTVRKIIPHPAWARPYDASQARDTANKPEYSGLDKIGSMPPPVHTSRRWEFNSDCTRMVSVTASDLPRPVIGEALDNLSMTGMEINASESLPGMVEVSISVAITGPGLGEFDVALEIVNEVNPASGRCIIGVDYYWGDLDGVHPPTGIPRDELLTIEMSTYYRQSDSEVSTQATFDEEMAVASVRRFATGAVLRSFVAHHALAPFGMNGVPYSNSFLSRFHYEALERLLQLANSVSLSGLRSALRDIRLAFRDEFTSISIVPGFQSSPVTVAQYEHRLQACFAEMLAAVMASSYSDKDGFRASMIFQKSSMSLPHAQQIGQMEFWSALLAFDLRILAFAVQSAAFINTGDTVQRQDRVQVIVRNEVVDTQQPPGIEFAAKVANYDLVTDAGMTGWTRMDCMTTMNPATSMMAFRIINTSGQGNPAVSRPETRTDFNTDYPVGAVCYALRALSFTPCDPYDVFCLHPMGHWSICTRPIVYYSGPSKVTTPGANLSFNHDDYNIDPAQFVQLEIDILCIKTKAKDGHGEVRKKHYDLFQSAYSKNDAKPFYFQFENVQTDYGSGIMSQTVDAKFATRTPVGSLRFWMLATQLRSGYTYVIKMVPAAYMDLRNYAGGTLLSGLIFFDGNFVASPERSTTLLPIGRGAALFGNHKQVKI